jgi:two-component system, response regulator, stage 0 sporulation protein F
MDKQYKLLYVDDEPLNLKLFSINFNKLYIVLTADSGLEGLSLLANHPDIYVVISDMKMPGMNGIEFIRIAKKEFPEVHFYILTGYDISDEIDTALQEGLINKYFRKPFNMREIDSSIREALGL